MTTETLTAGLPSLAPAGEVTWIASPFIHIGPDRVYNPLTDRTLLDTEPGYRELRAILALAVPPSHLPAATFGLLADAGWLVPPDEDLSRRFLLKYVSLESNTHCNQSCYFCPVSIAPRDTYLMPTELYQGIVRQIARYRSTIEAVFMINYNEPTADPRFVELVATLKEAGLPPAVLTNGTGLTPERVDRLIELGGLRFLSINLSTLDRDRYQQDRGKAHLDLVLKHVDYAASKQVAQQMDIVVLGTGSESHQADFRAIQERYSGSNFTAKYFEVNDRAGYLTIGLSASGNRRKLAGCEYVGSRPLQHLHVTPQGKAVLCCQDYNESVVLGDLSTQTVDEVLTGPAMAQARRWVYGLEEPPERFLCRNCRYALVRD